MKKKSPPYAIIGAAVLGLLAVFLIIQHEKAQELAKQQAIDAEKAEAQKAIDAANAGKQAVVPMTPTNMRNVLYATQPIDAGARLSQAFYESKPTPMDILPDAFTDKNDVTGFIVARKIEKGDPLTPRNIGKTIPFLSVRIPPGMREIALPIFNAEVNDTGGYIVDGDRVDLLFITSVDGTATKVETVLQNLAILSVPGSQVKSDKTDGVTPIPPPGEPLSVTFEVTPEQAEALLFLSQVKNGKFSMILRGRRDNVIAKIKPFEATDYEAGFKKVQTTTDKSFERVKALAAKIEDEEKKNGQGNTNETPPTTPPAGQ